MQWPRCIGLASASRTTGAEWKRLPMSKPLASAWCVGAPVSALRSYWMVRPQVKGRLLMKARATTGSPAVAGSKARPSPAVPPTTRAHWWSNSTSPLAAARRSPE